MFRLLSLMALLFGAEAVRTDTSSSVSSNCATFTVGSGTGCNWMCNYCSSVLQTNNYYFTDGVCTYQQGGCVGNPVSGNTYTCCSV